MPDPRTAAPASPSALFTPGALAALPLANRIVIAPMCQYSCDEGLAADWHLMHVGQLALSGAGLFILEATAVTRDGRITPGCLGLWSDAHEAALSRVIVAVKRHSSMPIGIQLSHAGRKASSEVPWRGGLLIPPAPPEPAVRTAPAWPRSSCTARTATCCTSSCRR